jgi:ABC-2 type transport system ATP-binding protein
MADRREPAPRRPAVTTQPGSVTAGAARRAVGNDTDIAVSVRNVTKRFRIYHERNDSLKASLLRGKRATYEELLAVDDVSFEVKRGETFGIVGQNGSGKSTMLKCLARILRPDAGTIEVNGKVSALLELGAGFHHELSGRENVYLNGSILGLSTKQLDERFDEIVEFAGLSRFIDTPVKNYSTGMYVRLGFSVAINVDPDVLLIDEVLAVGDEEFQRRCTEKFADMQRAGKTIVVVSHGLNQLRGICDRLAWLQNGKLRMVGDAGDVVDTYLGNVNVSRLPGHDGVSTRWGSGEAEILAVDVLGPDGQPTSVIRTGDRCTFRVRYRVNDGRVERPCIGFGIRRIDGVQITGVNNRESAMIPAILEGEGTFDYVVERVPLLPATYELSYALQDEWCTHTYDWWQDGCRFDVAPGVVHETEGVLTLFGRWEQHTPAGVRRDPEPGARNRRQGRD